MMILLGVATCKLFTCFTNSWGLTEESISSLRSDAYTRVGLARLDQSDYSLLSDLWAVPLMWNTSIDGSSLGYSTKGPPPTADDLNLFPDYGRKMWAQGLILARLRNTQPAGETLYRRVGRWFTDFDPEEEDRYLEMALPMWIDKAPLASIVVV